MSVFEQRVADCSLEELMAEVAVRMQESNGLDFVPDALADTVVACIGDYRREREMELN